MIFRTVSLDAANCHLEMHISVTRQKQTHWNGGPLVCQTNTSGVVLMGVKSWGGPCAGIQKPAVYSSVPAVMNWISKHLDTEWKPWNSRIQYNFCELFHSEVKMLCGAKVPLWWKSSF